MPSQWVIHVEPWVVEVFSRVVGHPEALHHRARPPVLGHREGHDFRQLQHLEGDAARLPRCLRRVPVAPRRAGKTPGDLDARGEVGVEPDVGQADEPDERFAALHLERPDAEPVLGEVCFDAIGESVALRAVEHAGEVGHDVGIGVQAREGLAIGVPPAAEEKPGRAKVLHS